MRPYKNVAMFSAEVWSKSAKKLKRNEKHQHYMAFIWTICVVRAMKYSTKFSIWHKVLMDEIIYLSVGWLLIWHMYYMHLISFQFVYLYIFFRVRFMNGKYFFPLSLLRLNHGCITNFIFIFCVFSVHARFCRIFSRHFLPLSSPFFTLFRFGSYHIAYNNIISGCCFIYFCHLGCDASFSLSLCCLLLHSVGSMGHCNKLITIWHHFYWVRFNLGLILSTHQAISNGLYAPYFVDMFRIQVHCHCFHFHYV